MHGLGQPQHPPDAHPGQHGQQGHHVACVARAGLYMGLYREFLRESATNDERRESAPRAVAWVASGDSCGRLGGFFCVPCARAGTRAEAGAPGCGPTGTMRTKSTFLISPDLILEPLRFGCSSQVRTCLMFAHESCVTEESTWDG